MAALFTTEKYVACGRRKKSADIRKGSVCSGLLLRMAEFLSYVNLEAS